MKKLIFAYFFHAVVSIVLLSCDSGDEPDFKGFESEPGNILTIAGTGPDGFGYEGDGMIANKARLGWVTGVAVDDNGNIFITDGAANTIRRISFETGEINTVAGKFRGFNVVDPTPFAGDGETATEAHLNIPHTSAIDLSGNIFIADAANHLIRKVDENDISSVAGIGGLTGYTGDGGQASSAKLYTPSGVATDGDGNVYFADAQNHVIRKITASTGIISTIAGLGPENAGYSGDNGPAFEAKINSPYGVTVDENGVIYFTDFGNHVVRKISNGIISTIAGTGNEGYTGDGGLAVSATFYSPKGIAVDSDGNIFVSDAGSNVVRKINNEGVITTYAGNGSAGFSGDGGPAKLAQLNGPWGVAVDKLGNLYIADTNNSAIRFVAK